MGFSVEGLDRKGRAERSRIRANKQLLAASMPIYALRVHANDLLDRRSPMFVFIAVAVTGRTFGLQPGARAKKGEPAKDGAASRLGGKDSQARQRFHEREVRNGRVPHVAIGPFYSVGGSAASGSWSGGCMEHG